MASLYSLVACSNSESINIATNGAIPINDNEVIETLSSSSMDYLPLDDSEYPYAGIPRIVIKTQNFQKIRDRETEIPAKLQIWGERAHESEILDLTIRGRGNTSWTDVPKKSYKIEFAKKQSLLGMPQDRDWALIANYADKTLMKNYLAYHLSAELGAFYAPRCEFVELYLNTNYLGVYLLTETIKISNHRIDIPKNDNSYIVEMKENFREGQQIVYSRSLKNDSIGKPFRIHEPKEASSEVLLTIQKHIEDFEDFLKTIDSQNENNITNWLDTNNYLKYYWVQEFSKNPDAAGWSSIYFTWIKGDVLRMGPVWDFDIAFGGHKDKNVNNPQDWYIKKGNWHKMLLKDTALSQAKKNFWEHNYISFANLPKTIDSLQTLLQGAANNNYKRWNILRSTEYYYHLHSYKSYKEAVDSLKLWVTNRLSWIDSQSNR